MNRIVSAIICAILLLSFSPAVFADSDSSMPAFPFELSAPEHVSVSKITSGDLRTVVSFSQPDDLIAFFREKEDASLAEVDLPGSLEAFYAKYGISDVYVNVQVDWAIDDVDDEVSGWHYRPVWDNDGYDENYNYLCGPWDMQSYLWSTETTLEAWLFGGVNVEYEEWLGANAMPDAEQIPGRVGLKDQVRDGQIVFDDDGWGIVDFENHTLYVRIRYELTVLTVVGEELIENKYFSGWSGSAGFGKDVPVWEPLEEGSLAAPDVSNLEMTMDEFNDYPVVKFDLAVPDNLALAVSEVTARGGYIRLCTEGRVPGVTGWVELQGDWIIKPGRIEMKLISLVDPELEENEGKVIINIKTPLELRCRYYVVQYESYGGEYVGEFYTPYSKVLKLSGGETVKGSGDVNGDGKVNAKDVTWLMKRLVGINIDGFREGEADFNGDGKINAKDVIAIMKYIVSGPKT